jgi:hypothetical protein
MASEENLIMMHRHNQICMLQGDTNAEPIAACDTWTFVYRKQKLPLTR